MRITLNFSVALALSLALFPSPLAAQRRAGRKAAPAKPSAPAPVRDLTGIWMVQDLPKSTFDGPKPELTPWGMEKLKQARSSDSGQYTLETTNDPVLTHCAPPGTPRVYFHPYPFELVHATKDWIMIYEYDHIVRRFYDDGRALPSDPDLTFGGTSVGHWTDDYTFVVETVGFNEKTWLDRDGRGHSDQLKVTETFHRDDMDHLTVGFKMEDPKALAKPWLATFHAELRPNWELGEISCSGDYLDFNKFEK